MPITKFNILTLNGVNVISTSQFCTTMFILMKVENQKIQTISSISNACCSYQFRDNPSICSKVTESVVTYADMMTS
jgi:hypothetical protein